MAKQYTITENRFEQWETEYGIKELGIYGTGMTGLVQSLAAEVETLRTLCAQQKKQLETYNDTAEQVRKEAAERIVKHIRETGIENEGWYDVSSYDCETLAKEFASVILSPSVL